MKDTVKEHYDKHNMSLPEGKTCSDCCHVGKCLMLFGIKETNTHCDFSPRRFIPKKEATA